MQSLYWLPFYDSMKDFSSCTFRICSKLGLQYEQRICYFKNLDILPIDSIHLKRGCIDGSKLDGVKKAKLFSFG